jgi:hypothetical protein
MAQMAQQDQLDQQVPRAQQVLQEQTVQRVLLVRQVPRALQVLLLPLLITILQRLDKQLLAAQMPTHSHFLIQ